jgi:hypothetical protein
MIPPGWRIQPLLLLAIAMLSSGCGRYNPVPPGASPSSGPAELVPWVDRPLPAYVAPSPTPYATSASPCRTTQLRIGGTQTGVGMSQAVLEVSLVNTGPAACLLHGQPQVSGIAASGVRVTLPARQGPTFAGGLVSADIAPGDHGYLDLGTGSACGTGADQMKTTMYRELAFRLPDRGMLGSHLTFSAGSCGVIVDQLGLPETAEGQPSPGPFARLTARLDAPSSVAAGSVLRYVVSVSNPTAQPIALSPCPAYTEWSSALITLASKVPPGLTYQLNCDTLTSIPPGATVRYAMELVIPATAPVGAGKFGWQLDESGGPYAGAALEVRAR